VGRNRRSVPSRALAHSATFRGSFSEAKDVAHSSPRWTGFSVAGGLSKRVRIDAIATPSKEGDPGDPPRSDTRLTKGLEDGWSCHPQPSTSGHLGGGQHVGSIFRVGGRDALPSDDELTEEAGPPAVGGSGDLAGAHQLGTIAAALSQSKSVE
jgi:hypothetical protein